MDISLVIAFPFYLLQFCHSHSFWIIYMKNINEKTPMSRIHKNCLIECSNKSILQTSQHPRNWFKVNQFSFYQVSPNSYHEDGINKPICHNFPVMRERTRNSMSALTMAKLRKLNVALWRSNHKVWSPASEIGTLLGSNAPWQK